MARELVSWAQTRLGPEASPALVFQYISDALREHLGRWIGADAFDALTGRAVLLGRTRYAALSRAEWRPSETPALTGLEPVCPGEDPFHPGLILITALVDQLGRFIGDEMASRLVRDGVIEPNEALPLTTEDPS